MNNIKKCVFIIFLCIVIVIIVVILYFLIVVEKYVNKDDIINKFKENITQFNNSLKEIDSEYIYFSRDKNDKEKIIISIHQKDLNQKINIIYVKEEDYYKYSEILKLINKLEIYAVSKEKENVEFIFNWSLKAKQSITNLIDEKHYIGYGNKINYKEHLEDNWYYIE